MGDLIERLGKLQDDCNLNRLGYLDTEYVWELAGRCADALSARAQTIESQQARIEELESGQVYAALTFQLAERNRRIAKLEKVREAADAIINGDHRDLSRLTLALADCEDGGSDE